MSKKSDAKDEAPEADPRAPIEGTWRGVTVWRCPFCLRDGEDKAVIEAHIAHAHPERSLSVTEALAEERAQAGLPPVVSAPDATAGDAPADGPEKDKA